MAVDAVRGWIQECRSLCVLTGAGVSAESGVPTFRGPEGLWKQRDPMSLATPEAFAEDPKEVWEWYQWRRGKIRGCAPNAGHAALAAVEAGKPDFLLVTQNVDGLHQAAGSRRVAEIHGSIWAVRCVGCGAERYEQGDFKNLPPRCGGCGGLLRPGVVWFGEMLCREASDAAVEMLSRCEVLIVAGTSAVVAPASGYAAVAKRRGARVIEVNPDETPVSGICDATFRGKSGEVLPALLG
ncbi:MAG: NAD-dependent deacylase [bacterium]|nr:NAD-dependent deacylase [bacterium]